MDKFVDKNGKTVMTISDEGEVTKDKKHFEKVFRDKLKAEGRHYTEQEILDKFKQYWEDINETS